jgi:hypothetical protein
MYFPIKNEPVVKKIKKTFSIFKINYTLAKLFETQKSDH